MQLCAERRRQRPRLLRESKGNSEVSKQHCWLSIFLCKANVWIQILFFHAPDKRRSPFLLSPVL